MEKNIERQHYVWRKYLRAWTVDNKLWCKRGTSIFNPAPENIALERFFYEVEVLSLPEFKLILKFIEQLPSANHELLVEHLMLYCTCSDTEFLKKNGLEKFHGIFENLAVPTLDALRTGNLTVLQEEQTRINFCKFIGRQYTRTKKMNPNVPSTFPPNIPVPEEFISCDMAKVRKVMTFLFSDSIGNWAYSSGKFSLLKAPQKSFITCDQPISNTKAIKGQQPIDIELFYPLSPEYALLISIDEQGERELAPEEEASWNQYIRSTAYQMIFANRRDLLVDL
jgi:hypothetical protein